MPRLLPRLLAHARRFDPLLPLLLPATGGNLPSAQLELRWLRAELPGLVKGAIAKGGGNNSSPGGGNGSSAASSTNRLRRAVYLRRAGFPLQYLLGSQPMRALDVLCKPGVLIPRWETEEWAGRLADLIVENAASLAGGKPEASMAAGPVGNGQPPLKIVDLCTGTGCIPMLLATEMERAQSLHGSSFVAVDVSQTALDLVARNLRHNASLLGSAGGSFTAMYGDVLADMAPSVVGLGPVDLVTANPPYIPEQEYARVTGETTTRSVRRFEPRLALVGDKEFYTAVFKQAVLEAKTRALVCEVGNASQIEHMQTLASRHGWDSVGVNDSAGRPRVVAIWDPLSPWTFLKGL